MEESLPTPERSPRMSLRNGLADPLDEFNRAARIDTPIWERRQCIDEHRLAHSELACRLSAVDVLGVEGADHLCPQRVLGDRSRALWAPKALALSSRPLHPSFDPLGQLPFLKLS